MHGEASPIGLDRQRRGSDQEAALHEIAEQMVPSERNAPAGDRFEQAAGIVGEAPLLEGRRHRYAGAGEPLPPAHPSQRVLVFEVEERKRGQPSRIAGMKLGVCGEEGGRAYGEDLLVEQLHGDRVRPVGRMTEADREVDRGVLVGAMIGGGDQSQLAVRDLAAQRAETRHQPEIGHVVGAGDGDHRIGPGGAHLVRDAADMAEPDADGVRQSSSLGRHREAPAGADEQRKREEALEVGDMAADRRLRDAELAGGGGEAAGAGSDFEHRERIQKRKILAEAHLRARPGSPWSSAAGRAGSPNRGRRPGLWPPRPRSSVPPVGRGRRSRG